LGDQITALIREKFDLRGVVLFDAPTERAFVSGNCAPKTEQGARDAYLQNSDAFDPETQTRYCALLAGARPVGGVALCGTTMPALMGKAIASLCAVTFE